jgi:hypothetical protein
VEWLAGVADRGGGQGSVQGRPVNLLVVEVSHDEASLLVIDRRQSMGVQSNCARFIDGAFTVFLSRRTSWSQG